MSSNVPDDPSNLSDPALLARLHEVAGTITGRAALAVVDRESEPQVRLALVRASADTAFEIGSISKALTGMLLAEDLRSGGIALETPLGEISPAIDESELASVTLLELATHTSGLPKMPHGWGAAIDALPYAIFGRNPYRGSPDSVIAIAARQPLRSRGRRNYSNIGGAVLGEALATFHSTDYSSLLTEQILVPLEMSATSVSVEGHTAPWGRASFGLPREPWVLGSYAPAGGLLSTIGDMVRLATALLQGSAPGMAALDPIDGVRTDRPHRQTGLFWIIDGPPDQIPSITWHNGGTGGYSSFIAIMPDIGRAVVGLQSVAGRSRRLQRMALALAS